MTFSKKDTIDALFRAWDRPDSPGCALGIYEDGESLYMRGYGCAHLEYGVPITPSTVFHVASLSKQFTAMAVGLLARSGRLSLDEDIRRYIPELPEGPPLTIRHFLHHLSGLRDQWDLLRLAGWRPADLRTTGDILRLVTRQKAQNFAPGTRFQYINTGYTLLGIAIERVTGVSLREYTEEHLFKPLGMRHTAFQDDHQRILPGRAQAYSMRPQGGWKINVPPYETVGPTGLFSTIEDFLLWERNFLRPIVGDAAFIQLALAPGAFNDGRPVSYGFGIMLGEYRGLPIAEHSGGDAGYRAHYLRFPEQRLAVVVFANALEIHPTVLARQVADVLLEGRFQSAPEAAVDGGPSGPELTSRVGLYRDQWSGITSKVKFCEGRLLLVPSTGGVYELLPAGPERFRFLNVDAECQFTSAGQMLVKYGAQPTGLCERVALEACGTKAPVSDYAGTYQSDELGVRWVLNVSGEALVLKRERFPDARIEFTSDDEGTTALGDFHLRFTRDGGGRVNGLSLCAERVWNVSFDRL